MPIQYELASRVENLFLERNRVCEEFFSREAAGLAVASQEMAARFARGGRLLAFGRGPYSTDAQHVSVEFVHPVIVGKRALPALDVSVAFLRWIGVLARPEDIVMGFGPPEGDPDLYEAFAIARARDAMVFALPGSAGSFAIEPGPRHPFIHQELLEILYHTLWETVHVSLELRASFEGCGDALFLYPFLAHGKDSGLNPLTDVSASIITKVREDAELRANVARNQADLISGAVGVIKERLDHGGKLILFGNGGSATDANDWALDCVLPPPGLKPIPAVSLALEPANITAISNDVGFEAAFLRQFIAHARREDVAIGISTSGSSPNLMTTFAEARKRNLLTVALLGNDGGDIRREGLADLNFIVPSDYIPRIQEVQASIYHVIRELLG